MGRRLTDYVKHTNLNLPHHQAFWELVQSRLPAGFLDDGGEGRSVWVSSPAPAPALKLEPAYKLIREFEGCHLVAYRCPAGIWTVGWGSTRINGRPVQQGDTITQARADELLREHVEGEIVPVLAKTIPYWGRMTAAQQSALVSFAYNLGTRFYKASGFATISRVLEQRQWNDVPEALLLYRNPGTRFENGLRRRREAEGRLWMSTPFSR